MKIKDQKGKKTRKGPEVIKHSRDGAREYTESILNTVREPLIVLDQDLRVVSASRSFYNDFKVSSNETVGLLVYDLGDKQWDIPKLRELLETILPQNTTFDNYEVEHDFAAIGKRIMLLNARQIQRVMGKKKIILLAIEDITDRRQAEKVLAEKAEVSLGKSEERYRLLVENINDVLYMLDTQGNVTYISPAVERVTKYKINDIIGKPFIPLIYPDDLPGLLDSFNRLSSGQLEPWEFRIVDEDGSIKFVRTSSRPIYEDGQIVGFTSLMTDITERKRAEDALKASEEQYRLLSEHMTDTVWLTDMSLKITYHSPSVQKLRGFTAQEIMEMPLEQQFTPESFKLVMEMALREIPRMEDDPGYNPILTMELEYTCKDGTTVWTENKFSVIRDENGKPVSILGEARDITKRRRAEEKLRAVSLYTRNLIEASLDPLVTIDTDGKITDVNKATEEVTGFSRERLIGTDFSNYFIEPHKAQIVYEKVFTQGIVRDYPLTIRHSSGRTTDVLYNASVFKNEAGEVQGVFAAARDITERKLTQEKLEKSYVSLKKTLNDAINTMVKIVEMRDPYTAGHQQKVADLATAIARQMKLEDTLIDQLRMAAVIHDIGKIYIPSDILSRPGKLSAMEFNLIKIHSQSGYDIVKSMDFPCAVAKAVLQHHERLDGSGYPNGLKGEDILLEAKILAVADVMEAMSSHRPYRSALGIDKALEEISKNSGILFDPDVVEACVELFKNGKFEFKPVQYADRTREVA